MSRDIRNRLLVGLAVAATALAWPSAAQTPLPDLCGCRNHPSSLGAFDTRNRDTWPPGTIQTSLRFLTIPLPADGVLVFDSMHIEHTSSLLGPFGPVEVFFQRNAANTPVTILVKENVIVTSSGVLRVDGSIGGGGTSSAAAAGGLGGPGGFRGGDGAFRLANLASDGGAGLGPGGGLGATVTPLAGASGGTFIGATDLLPLLGGSGGGGGRSSGSATNCSGGGGGGGGGGILIIANGIISVSNSSGGITGDGGHGGSSNQTCASGGGGGSGGAIRLVANTIEGGGRLFARGGVRNEDGVRAGGGSIRLEAIVNTFGVTNTDPIASRSSVPGPIVNPFTARVAVTTVAGQPVPDVPQGGYGAVDIQVAVPGATAIELAADGVPAGTTLDVKIKPRVGGPPIAETAILGNCDPSGRCLANITVDLAAGVYTVETRATFQSAQ